MKLINKKTGDTVKFVSIEPLYKDKLKLTYLLSSGLVNERYYSSIEKFNEDWEDYMPKEPLIKDEKIRKAVRAWAEANNIRAVYYSPEEDGFYVKNFDDEIVTSIYFADKPMEEDGYGEHYTIDELCGEEE